jgi:hypothetical protein
MVHLDQHTEFAGDSDVVAVAVVVVADAGVAGAEGMLVSGHIRE